METAMTSPLISVAVISHSWSTTTGAGRCAVELRDLLRECPQVRLAEEQHTTPPSRGVAAKAVFKLLRLIRLVKVFRRQQVRVVIVNTTVQSSAVLAARLAGCKVVWWCHESGTALEGPLMRIRVRLYDRLASRVVVVCTAVPPAVRTPTLLIRNIVSDAVRAAPSKPVLLSMGSKGWRKGSDLLPRLIDPAGLPSDTELWMVGPEDGREAELVALARGELTRRWGSRLRWLSAVEDVEEIYHDASLLLLPSRGEARPRVVEEALVRGIPVVASALPGLIDIAQTATDPRALKLMDLESDWTPAVRAALSVDVGRNTLIRPFSPAEFLRDWLSVIRECATD